MPSAISNICSWTSETTKIRTGFREEILDRASFNMRLDLALTREKYLKDLGIEQEVDASLKRELDDQIARLAGSDDLDQATSSIREALSLDEEADRIQVDVEKCIGCGVCVLACPQETLKLHRHERSSIAFETPRNLDEAMARENRE